MNPAPESPQAQKQRKGLNRLRHACAYSLAGLAAAWKEPAFRQEALAAVVLLPAACWLGEDWLAKSFLAACVVLVMVVELLNTGIEAAIDRIGPEWHVLSKRAKDMGSAAVLLSLLLCGAVWLAAICHKFWT